jgi:hypothetical protein
MSSQYCPLRAASKRDPQQTGVVAGSCLRITFKASSNARQPNCSVAEGTATPRMPPASAACCRATALPFQTNPLNNLDNTEISFQDLTGGPQREKSGLRIVKLRLWGSQLMGWSGIIAATRYGRVAHYRRGGGRGHGRLWTVRETHI